ncbi:MAG TPA: ribosome-associated translation inhibitor RaiA [Polyangiaceae bacterium]|nr:ribosome-associated translation inhibitor RaiA [Polyangiaceae bacterium]
MNISITFRHIEPSEPVKKYAQEKMAKLQKFLRQPMQAHVILDTQRIEHVAEVRISAGSEHYQGREQSEDMYASIDLVLDKLERQIRSGKEASVAKKKHGSPSAGQFAAAAAVVDQNVDQEE